MTWNLLSIQGKSHVRFSEQTLFASACHYAPLTVQPGSDAIGDPDRSCDQQVDAIYLAIVDPKGTFLMLLARSWQLRQSVCHQVKGATSHRYRRSHRLLTATPNRNHS
jgi:hypothetical protein